MTRQLKPCGTQAAYTRHLRHGEQACAACRKACRDRARQQRAAVASMATGTVLCGAEAASCRCREPAGHDPDSPHACPCGGSWRGDIDTDSFEPVILPPIIPVPGLADGEVW